MNTGPELIRNPETRERNWFAVAIAAGILIVVVVVAVIVTERGRNRDTVAPVSAAADAYATNLPITDEKMSESTSLSGGKVTYLDGHILNKGGKTVTGISVQVLFRNVANEVAQNETLPLQLIRTTEPYVDTQPVSSAPLKPGEGRDFRLIFDPVTADWDGAFPQIRILRVQTQ